VVRFRLADQAKRNEAGKPAVVGFQLSHAP
jgi:hypothetical protein